MWYAAVLRCLRRRFVLAIIFLLSLTYFLVNLLGTGTNSALSDIDEMVYKREVPLIWRPPNGHTTNSNINGTAATAMATCRNSVQGKSLIVDDEGYVCSRSNLAKSGCCNIVSMTSDALPQYSCHSCNGEMGCCAIYEYCVSCCLNPARRADLEIVLDKSSRRQLALFAMVKDQYELCLAKCRTDSTSVEHENKYKDPNQKHCYRLTEAHDSQRDQRANIVH